MTFAEHHPSRDRAINTFIIIIPYPDVCVLRDARACLLIGRIKRPGSGTSIWSNILSENIVNCLIKLLHFYHFMPPASGTQES